LEDFGEKIKGMKLFTFDLGSLSGTAAFAYAIHA